MSLPKNIFPKQIYRLYEQAPNKHKAADVATLVGLEDFTFSKAQLAAAYSIIAKDEIPEHADPDISAIGRAIILIKWMRNANMSDLLSGCDTELPEACQGYTASLHVTPDSMALAIKTPKRRHFALYATLPTEAGDYPIA